MKKAPIFTSGKYNVPIKERKKVTAAVTRVYGTRVVPDVHVVPDPNGWAVEWSGKAERSVHATREEAMRVATERAMRDRVELVIHARDGKIQERIPQESETQHAQSWIINQAPSDAVTATAQEVIVRHIDVIKRLAKR